MKNTEKTKKRHRHRHHHRPLFYMTLLLLFIDSILLGVWIYIKSPSFNLGFWKSSSPRVTMTELEIVSKTANSNTGDNDTDTDSGSVLGATDPADTKADTATSTDNDNISEGSEASSRNISVSEAFTVSAQTPVETPSEYQIEDFDIIYQNPELPTGCEITALTMALCYYGYEADKITMASEYLPTADAIFYYGSDGLKYGPDLNKYFVGDPFSSGYICGTEAIVTAADAYLKDVGSDMTAHDLTGFPTEELYSLASQDIPVVVWVTIDMTTRYTPEGWYTEEREWVEWSSNDHGAVLIGYTEDTVTIADPISGMVVYDRDTFESVFSSRGNQCVILQ